MIIEDPSLSAHGYQLLPQQPVRKWMIIGNLMFQAYFEVFYSLLVGHTFKTLKIDLLPLR